MSISVTHSVLSVGAAAPFRIIRLSDTHLTYADLRDGERKVKLIDWRLPSFPHAEAVLAEAGALSKELNIPIFHTGDLIDYVSLANLEAVRAFSDEHDRYREYIKEELIELSQKKD